MKWEYETLEFGGGDDLQDLNDLNGMGDQGWEACGVLPYFKPEATNHRGRTSEAETTFKILMKRPVQTKDLISGGHVRLMDTGQQG